jgi:hypothetical protein
MIEYDPVIQYQNNMEGFLNHRWNKYDSSFENITINYFIGDYNNFLNLRSQELNIKNNWQFNIKKFLSNNFSFRKEEKEWSCLKKFIKQTYYFTGKNNDKFYISFEDSYFSINEKTFYIIKNYWKDYIDFLINRNDMLKTKIKIQNF